MAVTLYTSRVVLNILGVENYGIYTLIGGLVSMFIIVSGSMTTACQRFLSYALGKNDPEATKEIFSASVSIHLILGAVIFILAETVGLWFLNTRLEIAPDRLGAANWVFQCSLAAFLINLVSVPYNAVIISHEKMKVFAYISFLEVFLKLVIVLVLPLIMFDRLKVYSVLILAVAVIIRLIYQIYSRRHFEETNNLRLRVNKKVFGEMFSFAGWNFMGASSSILMTQGASVMLNLFFGVVVNAARGIAAQVENAVMSFSYNFMTAITPQITKSYASGDWNYMWKLVERGARFCFYLVFLLSLPILFETETILTIWLKTVPDYAVVFVQLSLIAALFQTFSFTLSTAILATGRVKYYQISTGTVQFLYLPVAYVFLKAGSSPVIVYILAIVIALVVMIARLIVLKKEIGISISDFLKRVFFRALLVAAAATVIPLVLKLTLEKSLISEICIFAVALLSALGSIYLLGFTKPEKRLLAKSVSKLVNRKR